MPDRTIYLSFIGDSLIQKPACMYNMFEKIRNLLGNSVDVVIYSFASGGSTIQSIKSNQLESAISMSPDAILIYYDTDVSDIDEHDMDDHDIVQLREIYRSTLRYVINRIVGAKILVAFGGPELLGEGPAFKPSAIDKTFQKKEGMLNDYVRINEEVTSQFNNTYASGVSTRVPYMNLRQDFLDSMSSYWKANGYFKCALTLDGEHPNEAGADIIARRFASTIQQLFDPSIYVNRPRMIQPLPFADDEPPSPNIQRHCPVDMGLSRLETCLTYESLSFVGAAYLVLLMCVLRLRRCRSRIRIKAGSDETVLSTSSVENHSQLSTQIDRYAAGTDLGDEAAMNSQFLFHQKEDDVKGHSIPTLETGPHVSSSLP